MNGFRVFLLTASLVLATAVTRDTHPPLWAGESNALIAEYSEDDPVAVAPLPEGVTVTLDPEMSFEGVGSWRVAYTGNEPVFTALFEVPLADIDDCQLLYTAHMRSSQVTTRAYLEMWCVFPGGKAFFSKALNETLTGDRDWISTSTPFFLRKGEKPEKAVLGARLEGPGTVWMTRVRLYRQPLGIGNPFTAHFAWIPGTVLGLLGGLYGTLAGILAPRGRGRALVLGMGIFIDGACFLMLIAGIVLLAGGFPYDAWYPWLLTGVIGSLTVTGVLPVIFKRYRDAELRRMDAMDLG
ncbi:MAG: hypothetical protein ACE15F_23510 [bacterium]